MALDVPCYPAILTLDQLGGKLENCDGIGVEDPTTDLDAGCDNASRASAAAMSRTGVRAWARFALSNAPALTATNSNDAAWARNTVQAGRPTITRSSTGVFDVTWPATMTDELGVTGSTALRWARVQEEGSVLFDARCQLTAPNVVRVWIFNSAGALADLTSAQVVLVQAG